MKKGERNSVPRRRRNSRSGN
uniref:Uncharacterized protein n=1 Tax=Arundo donax TaxID=35708 RepID=A0A0A9HIG8_ARUDO